MWTPHLHAFQFQDHDGFDSPNACQLLGVGLQLRASRAQSQQQLCDDEFGYGAKHLSQSLCFDQSKPQED